MEYHSFQRLRVTHPNLILKVASLAEFLLFILAHSLYSVTWMDSCDIFTETVVNTGADWKSLSKKQHENDNTVSVVS